MEVVMLEQYFLRPTTVDRIRSTWLVQQIEQYVEWMHAQKYAEYSITHRIAILCHFADFARTHGVTDLASASSLVEMFGDHWIAGKQPESDHCKYPPRTPPGFRLLQAKFFSRRLQCDRFAHAPLALFRSFSRMNPNDEVTSVGGRQLPKELPRFGICLQRLGDVDR